MKKKKLGLAVMCLVLIGFFLALGFNREDSASAQGEANTNIKTAYLTSYVDIAQGETATLVNANRFTPSSNITVVGAAIIIEILTLNNVDYTDGSVSLDAELSRVPFMTQDGTIVYAIGKITAHNVRTSYGVTQVVLDSSATVHERIMFPAGYGMDFNAGESIYLNMFYGNGMYYDYRVAAMATIYYIDR